MPETMRAVTQSVLGGTEVLELADVPRPEPHYGEVLVRVHAASLNPVDPAARELGLYIGAPPFTLGWDVSGTVAAIGEGVTRFRVGDAVFGMPRFPHRAGAHAEFVTGPARHFAAKPQALSHVEAAAMPLTGLTAWQALIDRAGLSAGQTVLIHAAAGGIGHLAVQIAKAAGATVIGTASAPNRDFVLGLGADEVIDYRSEDFTATVKDVDVALSTLGGDVAERSVSVLKDGGVLCQCHYSTRDRAFPEAVRRGIDTRFMLVEPDPVGLGALADLVEAGRLRPHVAKVFALEEFAAAHAAMEAGGFPGKIVFTLVE
ncbi:NADP-dependent oxidoreductase [Glycomyces paridis]|uniref:NADP-dependent oxidoreductase n=1 Tax=Glycomyces paridis TaxID=2126555 RepID=UPI00195C6108|nr:NADP-dependent oxidoreductase [Glycomyces paridis]